MLNNATAVQASQDMRAGRETVIAWLALTLAVALVVTLYLSISLSVSDDPLLMPLDDTYIHFQYARQMAQGQPMVYYDGDPATSGGTSLLYPPLLAAGYLLGFSGWSLANWALGIGVLCHFGAAWLVYLIGRDSALHPNEAQHSGMALLLALAFAVSGPFVWAALSGMETALFVFVVLLTLYTLQQDRFGWTVGAATLMTLTRPEGMILAGIAMVALALRIPWPTLRADRFWRAIGLALPVLAGGLQPLINLLATSSVSSSGMQAKSHLYNTSISFVDRMADALEFFGRMWKELLLGESPDWGNFTPWLLTVTAFTALLVGLIPAWRNRRVALPVVIIVWMLALTAAVATLDTAFWQFKRYQLPVIALFFPAAAWGSALMGERFAQAAERRWARWPIPVIILTASVLTAFTFARNYGVNVRVVHDQQVLMATWAREHLPEDARVGVHDVGLMGYFSGLPLYDVVGLTLPGPAESWRQGPGAIYEHMAHSPYRPDYFAIYPDVQGLRYLLNAGVFGDVQAEFGIELPKNNVASATNYQAIYAADWSRTREIEQVAQVTTLEYIDGFELVDWIDVANLESEVDHHYKWWQDEQPPGFLTETFTHIYHACGLPDEVDCWGTDGGRVLTGGEEFTLNTCPGEDLLLVTRVFGHDSVPLRVFANGVVVATRVQPAVPGRWLEIVTLIPGDIVLDEVTIRIEADGVYRPYFHWAYAGTFLAPVFGNPAPVAMLGDAGQVRLIDYELDFADAKVDVALKWLGPAPDMGDGVVFIHLYNSANIDVEPVAQVVARPAGGVLPPGNWLPGEIHDAYTLPLPDDLPPGEYIIALGIFDNITGERYAVSSNALEVDDNRLFIGEITVEELAGGD